jgi:hypothetical protein
MLDMGYLTYAPDHQYLRGSDHAIVVLALTTDSAIVHDPNGYPAVPLPLDDFLEAWQRDIYTSKPYGLWRIGPQDDPPTAEVIWERTLGRARENLARTSERIADDTVAIYGPEGMRALAAHLRAHPDRDLGVLPYFSWRVSGQRCLDSTTFLHERLLEAAQIRWEECQLYGALQQATAANNRSELPVLLERLAEQEAHVIEALGAPDSAA